MAPDIHLRIEDVWAKQAYGLAGKYLGVVEAVGFRRGTVRRIGVPMRDSDRACSGEGPASTASGSSFQPLTRCAGLVPG